MRTPRGLWPAARLRFAAVALLFAATSLSLGARARTGKLEGVRGSSPLAEEEGKIVTVEGAVDPHGDTTACAECHALSEDGTPTADTPSQSSCERCHPETNFHLVGIAPEEVPAPEEMLLLDGLMTCLTCHDEPACDGFRRDERGEDHLRTGPFQRPLDLCFRCHEREDYQRTDPHRDLRTTDGRRNDAVCIFCHQGVPETVEDYKVEATRVNQVDLCKACHAHQIHVGIPSHLVIAPEETVSLVDQYNARHEYPIPLGSRGEITCTTCHDPHPGLDPIPVDTTPRRLEALRVNNRAYRDEYYLPRYREQLAGIRDADGRTLELRDGTRNKDGLLRVPAEDGTLCLICHDLGGEE